MERCTTLNDLIELEVYRATTTTRGNPLVVEFLRQKRDAQLAAANNDGMYRGPLPSFQCQSYIRWLDSEITGHRKGRIQQNVD